MADPLTNSWRASHLLGALLVLAALVFALVAWSSGDRFYLRLATEALIFSGLALSVDILLGHAGLLPLGQALFFGLGAYVSALVLINTGSFWMAMGAVFGACLVVSAFCGLLISRSRGVYFALISFGVAQVVSRLVYNTPSLGGSDGLRGIPLVDIRLGFLTIPTDEPLPFFLFTLGFIILLYAIAAYVLNTPAGRALSASRMNETRLSLLGYSTRRMRIVAFVGAAEIAALSGALFPLLRGFVSPELMGFSTSTNAIIGVVIGGVGTLTGALYGAIVLVLARSIIANWTEHHLIFIGATFVLIVIFLPGGLLGLVRLRLQRAMHGIRS